MQVSVIGSGAWGTALAKVLDENGHSITLWGRDPSLLKQIRNTGYNERYLPGISLGSSWCLTSNLQEAVSKASVGILAVPSGGFRGVVTELSKFEGCAVSVTKGIEFSSGKTMTGLIQECMPRARAVALSGPTLAAEVAQRMPTAIVAAADQIGDAKQIQTLFHLPHFRVYSSNDPVGVELGGALKNVIAIAAGICQGLGFGDNSKAALVTRAIAEIRRLGVACGAMPETFSGLGGLGDLVVTCFSNLSRNRTFGEKIGSGEKAAFILESTASVVEGYHTAKSAWKLARDKGVDAPIIQEVHAMLHEDKPLRQAVEDLLSREAKEED